METSLAALEHDFKEIFGVACHNYAPNPAAFSKETFMKLDKLLETHDDFLSFCDVNLSENCCKRKEEYTMILNAMIIFGVVSHLIAKTKKRLCWVKLSSQKK